MASTNSKVITVKEARKQINHFGRSLVLYILLFMAFYHGLSFLQEHVPAVFSGIDTISVLLIGQILLMLFVTLVPFQISSHALHLNIKDYLKDPRLRIDRKVALVCIGLAIYFVTVSVSTLLQVFFQTGTSAYDFLGVFTTQNMIVNNLLYFVLFVFVKPICDEYIFRGVIQRQLGHYGRYFGVLGSAFLYAIAQMDLIQAIPAFFLGWYLALVTLRYHSIRPSRQIHVFVALFIWVMDCIPGNYIWVISVFVILIYALAGLFLFQKRVDSSMVRYGATEGKLWKILLSSSSILLCVILFVANVILSKL